MTASGFPERTSVLEDGLIVGWYSRPGVLPFMESMRRFVIIGAEFVVFLKVIQVTHLQGVSRVRPYARFDSDTATKLSCLLIILSLLNQCPLRYLVCINRPS